MNMFTLIPKQGSFDLIECLNNEHQGDATGDGSNNPQYGPSLDVVPGSDWLVRDSSFTSTSSFGAPFMHQIHGGHHDRDQTELPTIDSRVDPRKQKHQDAGYVFPRSHAPHDSGRQ